LWLFSRFLRASKSRKQQEENRGRNSDPVHGCCLLPADSGLAEIQ